jgi:hypothetical protein
VIAFFSGALGLIVAGLIVFLIRRDRLHVHHGLQWLLVAAGFSFLGFAPNIIDFLASKLGIAYPPSLGFAIAITVLVVKILLMDIDHSKLRLQHQRLTQRVAMLEGLLHHKLHPEDVLRTERASSSAVDESQQHE